MLLCPLKTYLYLNADQKKKKKKSSYMQLLVTDVLAINIP